MFEMAHALAYCEKHDCELRCDDWVGFKIFRLTRTPILDDLPRRSDHDLQDGDVNVSLRGYFQNARSANISNVVVQWSLTSQTSGGILLSQYGITNTSGIAFAFYAGPVLSGALTETISVAVATVE